MLNENKSAVVTEDMTEAQVTSETFWRRQDEEFWQAMREVGVNEEIYAAFCELIKPMPQIFWNDDKLYKKSDKGAKPVANFLPVPTEEILYDDGKEQQRYFRMIGRKSEEFKITEHYEILKLSTIAPQNTAQ